jgi:endonuclease-8
VPEGDTIHRAAATLQRALAGKRVTRFETVFPQLARVDEDAPIAGRTIERVRAEGKHLVIELSGDLALRTHMRMNGNWHIYRAGEKWQRPHRDMRIVLGTDDFVAVAFNVPIAEFHDARSLARQSDIRQLGPDLARDDFDRDEALRRIRARGADEIADVLLNQRVVAGIGNVLKSETLFIANVNPFRRVDSLAEDELARIIDAGVKLMRVNVHGSDPGRRTRSSLDPGEKLWVYGRGGEPCRRCGTPIAYRKQGRDVRGTYWCPRCQP